MKQQTKKTLEKIDEVYVAYKDYTCESCSCDIKPHDLYSGNHYSSKLCIKCVGLDHLEFLPSGNQAMTRRVKKHSDQVVEVYNRSHSVGRSRKARKGLLVKKGAIQAAEIDCTEDEEKRKKQREKARLREEKRDQEYKTAFSQHVRRLFPGCPDGVEYFIAEHACEKHSGRVGRCASAKQLDDNTVSLAVWAHARHNYTDYDNLLDEYIREDARKLVQPKLDELIERWKSK